MLKGIKWSVVPLPCFSLWPKSSFGKQGSGPDRGQSPVEWEDFPYVCPSICLSINMSPLLSSGQAWWPRRGYIRMDGRTENLPILQDFVPYWGRCLKKILCSFPFRLRMQFWRSQKKLPINPWLSVYLLGCFLSLKFYLLIQ